MKEISVLLADDHEVVLDSLAMMIASLERVNVLATATNGLEVLDKLTHLPVDIVLSDMHMPELSGIELALRLREHYPATKLILLTMEEEPETIRSAMQAGVWGYVLKRATKKELEKAILSVADGARYFTEEVHRQLAQIENEATPNGHETPDSIQSLSKREIEIVRLIASEVSSQDIADQLFISPSTVETHRRNIFKKLDIHSVVALTRFAIRNKIV
ncbi:response regulator [Persicitalea jodogahamensis]|uniref:DNA-binding response regulator n=1 Tax=Persicitalea jodogahamensis TaxID=402147 RepID=A0A8J3G9C5_9BACT|nr:response regulator transcription factor [Persicitalea jodogahamensis]GHB62324.1 DNA-binding response regulator [Persicitalea jodogahamensis]